MCNWFDVNDFRYLVVGIIWNILIKEVYNF